MDPLRSRVLRALRWSAAAKLVGQVMTWAVTIVVIRLLEPKDYGIIAMALIFKDVMMMFNEMGLGAALIQRTTVNRHLLRQTLTLVLIGNILFALIMFFGAWPAAQFFGEPALVPVMQVLAIQFIIGAFEAIPVAMMERELDLKRKSIVFLTAQVAASVVTLAFAWHGFGVWSLVWGSLAGAVVRSVLSNFARPCPLVPSFDLRGMKDLLSFGGLVSVERLLWYFSNRADIFIVGRLMGTRSLGIYSVAMELSTLIMTKTGEILYTVSFPAFSSIKHDLAQVSLYFMKAVRIMSFAAFPLFWGLSAVAPETVQLLLGEKWEEAGPILQLLCLIVPLRMLVNLLPPVLQGIGRPGRSVMNLVYSILLLPVAFWVGADNGGLIGVCIAWLAMYPLAMLLMLRNALPLIGLPIRTFAIALLPSLSGAAVMYAAVWLARGLLPDAMPLALALAALVAVGVVVYAICAWLLNRAVVEEVLDLMRRG